MKILNAKQLSEVDQHTTKEQGLSDWELMERASDNAFMELLKYIDITKKVYLFCGTSNNGGDGLAIARMLHYANVTIEVFEVQYSSSTSEAYQKNLALLEDLNIEVKSLRCKEDLPDLRQAKVIVDAIFGVGLNRRMPDFIQELVQHINTSKAKVISIDVPSGMYIEQAISSVEQIIHSDICLSFQLPKLAFLLPSTGSHVENFRLIDIGLSLEKIEQIQTPYHYLTMKEMAPLLKKRNKFSHKGTYGNALLIGGQQGMFGSVVMSSMACLRSGVGKVYTHLDTKGQVVLNQHSLESIYVEDCLANLASEVNYNAVGIGMGLGTSAHALQLVEAAFHYQSKGLLLDADAISLLSKHTRLIELISKYSVLTPHLGELQRLIGSWANDFEMLTKVREFCLNHQVIVVVKGAHTLICDGKNYYFNSTGNPGLAKAGTGDALSGIITALLAQNFPALVACQLGVFLHGLAADLALETQSEQSLIATDVIEKLPKAFQLLEEKNMFK